jgi:hypothetical protein
MSGTFLQRNKKKSLLAALLLFLRQRKLLVLLLFLVLMASTVFLSPSSWITSFPGGQRFAAGVAWVAGKMGFDVSRWGLGPGKHSYEDLLAAFKAAKASGNGSGGVGWGAFFGRGGASGSGAGGSGGAPNSLDFVKGSKSDLDHGVGAGADAGGAGSGGQTVAGIVDPADPKNRGGDAVAIGDGDLSGERETYFTKDTLAGGFMKGLFGGGGGPGSGGDASLSGGPFAGKGFFSGTGGAAGGSNGLAKAGLSGLPPLSTPSSAKGGPAVGKLSSMASRAIDARGQKGVLGASALGGNLAYTQLAEGNSRAQLGTQYCKAPDCPSEYAATNTGAIYDGNNISAGFLTSSDPGGNASGLINSTVVVPPQDPGAGGVGGGGAGDAQNMQTCANLVQTCEQNKTATMPQVGKDEDQLKPLYNQIAGACGDPCHCGNCNNIKGQIAGLCADLKVQLAASDKPCAPLPDYCAALGFTPAQFDSSALGQNCQSDFGQCGPKGLLAQLACLLGS